MDARLTAWRLLSIVGIGATVIATSACGGGSKAPAAAKVPPLVTYRSSLLSFEHPAVWKAYPYQGRGELHFQPIVYLSTQQVHDPCTTQGKETTCGLPVGHLQSGGVLVVWQFPYMLPGTGLGSSGAAIRVDGRRARRVATSGGMCRPIGADRTIDVLVKQSPTNYVEVTACLRGPHLALAEKSFDDLLASTRFLSQ
jgi:hypothetical protein